MKPAVLEPTPPPATDPKAAILFLSLESEDGHRWIEQDRARREETEREEQGMREDERGYRPLFEAARHGILIPEVKSVGRSEADSGPIELWSFPHGEKLEPGVTSFREFDPQFKLEAVAQEDYNHLKEQTAGDVCLMSRATPQMRKFARRLLTYETPENKLGQRKIPSPVFQSSDRLRPHLTTLMGTGGYRALLSRALALAGAEVPWLRTVQMSADGSLEGLEELHVRLEPGEFLEGRLVLLAQLVGLLAAFIGENLTVRLVGEAWPKVPLDDLDFIKGGQK